MDEHTTCWHWCGEACVSGCCPKPAFIEANACANCFYNEGCSNCILKGTSECPKYKKE